MKYKDKKKDTVIVCPHCGREYLPAEIFVPNAFFGHPVDIDRISGKIETYEGRSMDTKEEYRCDNCDAVFTVEAQVRFKVTEKVAKTFNETYVTPLYAKKLSLSEDM